MNEENDPFESVDDSQSNNKTFAIVTLFIIICILIGIAAI